MKNLVKQGRIQFAGGRKLENWNSQFASLPVCPPKKGGAANWQTQTGKRN